MRNTALASPMQAKPGSSPRNSMLAKVHVAKKQLGMFDDDYYELIMTATKGQCSSAGDCTDAQLVAVLDAFKAKGFRAMPGKAKAGRHIAMHPMARKARIMWRSLYHLGVVHNPAEEALEVFARKQLKCERLAWAQQSQGGKLIEALKDMGERNGWVQVDHKGNNLGPLWLNAGLCEAIVKKLKKAGEIPADWTLDITAYRLLGLTTAQCEPWTVEQFQQLAAGLGEKLRAAIGQTGVEA